MVESVPMPMLGPDAILDVETLKKIDEWVGDTIVAELDADPHLHMNVAQRRDELLLLFCKKNELFCFGRKRIPVLAVPRKPGSQPLATDEVEGQGDPENHKPECNFWKCGLLAKKWAKTIAVFDMIKGILGLIFVIYLAISALFLITGEGVTKAELNDTELFLIGVGKTDWGVVLFVSMLVVYNCFLTVFGRILYTAVNQENIEWIRLWYIHCVVSVIVSMGLYIPVRMAVDECMGNKHCTDRFTEYSLWLKITLIFPLLYLPTVFSLAVVQSLCDKIRLSRSHGVKLGCTPDDESSGSDFKTMDFNAKPNFKIPNLKMPDVKIPDLKDSIEEDKINLV